MHFECLGFEVWSWSNNFLRHWPIPLHWFEILFGAAVVWSPFNAPRMRIYRSYFDNNPYSLGRLPMCKRNLHDTIPNFLYRYYLWLSDDSLAVDLSYVKNLELNPSLKRLHFNLKNNGEKDKIFAVFMCTQSRQKKSMLWLWFLSLQ